MGILVFFFGILLFWSLLQRHCRDRLRFELFSHRDELFLYAAQDHSFDSKAYRYTESFLNHIILYSDKISIFQSLLFQFMSAIFFPNQKLISSFLVEMQSEIGLTEPRTKQIYRDLLDKVDKSILVYLVSTNPILWVVVAFFWLREQTLRASSWKLAIKKELAISLASIKQMANDDQKLHAAA